MIDINKLKTKYEINIAAAYNSTKGVYKSLTMIIDMSDEPIDVRFGVESNNHEYVEFATLIFAVDLYNTL